MPNEIDFGVSVEDSITITIPRTLDAIKVEQVGKALVNAGQEGYTLKSLSPIQRDFGNQRDPDVRTLGVRIKLTK